MKLATRLWTFGAAVPFAAMAVVSVVGALALLHALEHGAGAFPQGVARHAVATFLTVAAVVTLVLGAALILIQVVAGRRVTARIRALSRRMAALREGNLDIAPPRCDASDEIGELLHAVAEAAERLKLARAAQERLVADAAHELRTPLGLMRTSIDLALRRKRDAAELVAALEDTRREVERLAQLSTRLLDLAAAHRGHWDRTPGDLVRVVREAAEAVRAEAEAKGVVVLEGALEPVLTVFDAHGVRQAVDNLLSNAVKFSPERGIVLVTVERRNGHAVVSVHDDGPGIPPEDRERVFEPFERGGHGGAGLGLAIVREVARGHGGRAYVADEPGATVVLEIPMYEVTPVPRRSPLIEA